MIVYTCSINLDFPFLILKDKYLLINTNKKMNYPHLIVESSLSLEETSDLICKYLEGSKLENKECVIKEGVEVVKIRKMEKMILDMSKEDRQIEKILNIINE